MKAYNQGTKVKWEWGNGEATGEVTEHFTDDITRQIDGEEITRHASSDNPAYLITQEDGSSVLKSHSEIKKANRFFEMN